MRRAPAGIDLGVYAAAVPLLVRNPAIIVIPLLMAVVGVLVGMSLTPGGGLGTATAGLGGLIVRLLELFGLGAACLIADDAWRHGRASFDNGWSEARRRGGEILFAAVGVTLLISVAGYAGSLFGSGVLAIALVLVAAVFLVWAIPAAALGGVPGAAAIQVSIERVRANPAAAVLVTVVSLVLEGFLTPLATAEIFALIPAIGSTIAFALVGALLQAIAIGYIALVLTKTFTDATFARR